MFKNLRINKATLVDIVLWDSTSFKFCNYFKDIGSYTVSTLQVSNFQNSINNSIPNLELSSISDSTIRTRSLLGDLLKSKVTVTIRDLDDDTDYIMFKGQVSSVTIQDNWIDLDCQGFISLCNQNLNPVYSKLCTNDLGDVNCGVDTDTYDETGTVTTVTSRSEFIDTSRTEADNYFQYGILTFTSGSNNGIEREVLEYDSSDDSLTLFLPFPYDIEIGDTYSVYRGCDKTADTCKNTFSNYENFRGYAEYTPDQDDLIYNPDDDDEEDIDDESDEVDDAT